MKKWVIGGGLLLLFAGAGMWGYRYALQNAWIRVNEYDIRSQGTLQVGELAPDLDLSRSDGEGSARLSDYFRDKPLVLIFGSYT